MSVTIALWLAWPISAAISRTGSGSGTASFTFSATATGDLQIVYAFIVGSRTAPTLPSGWTSVATGSTSGSGTTAAYAVACKIASGPTDTSSGTWTGSPSNISGVSYAGTSATSTSTCNTVGIGNTVANNAKSSTTVTYGSVTISSNKDWVAAFMGGSGSSICAPATILSNVAGGTGGTVAVADSNGTVSSYGGQTCTVTSETWMSFVIDVMAPASGGAWKSVMGVGR